MDSSLKTAAIAGYERVAAWADLLDDINVYPVPDADTGRNLKISLAPIRDILNEDIQISTHLLRAATGNSGIIAAAFFAEFLEADSTQHLPHKTAAAKDRAWAAIADPQPGTMLSVFTSLSEALDSRNAEANAARIVTPLIEAVQASSSLLPELEKAGVVDSGALGMFLFFEGFFKTLYEENPEYHSPFEIFGKKLHLDHKPDSLGPDQVCISTLIKTETDPGQLSEKLQGLGSSVVTVREGDHLKIHLHAESLDTVRREVASWGHLVEWEAEPIVTGPKTGSATLSADAAVHIVTDAAGSITRRDADHLGITLMDSYVVSQDRACPETAVDPEELYRTMRAGQRATTAQASLFERRQSYESLCSRYDHIVYLCVGSAYTGIYQVAESWQSEHPLGANLTVMDSGAASGRLGLIARATAAFARQGHPLDRVVAFARTVCAACYELVFLDQLKYLAAGGRISKTGGFFGDLFRVKPIISPQAAGVAKVGVARKQAQQLPFALAYFGDRIDRSAKASILLQHTDNRERVATEIQPAINTAFPRAEISLVPLSLTSGVHMGPGTWAMAVLPEL